MSFAGASFAETAFASQASIHANVAVSGLPLTSVTGTASITAIQNPNVSVTGLPFSVTLGGSGVSAGGNAEITLSGLPLNLDLGEESIVVDSPNVNVTGQGLTLTQGTATALSSTNPQPAGLPIQTTLNNSGVTVVAVQNVNISVTGQPITTTLNNSGVVVNTNANVLLTPLTLISTALGNVTLQMNGDVSVTGFQMNIVSSTSSAVYTWTEVDDSETSTWTEVDDSATMTWNQAA